MNVIGRAEQPASPEFTARSQAALVLRELMATA